MSKKSDVFSLTKDEAIAIGKAGGPTFHPLARKKFRLNQLDRFGPLTCRQCNVIRGTVGPYLSDTALGLPITLPLPEAVIDSNGHVICPICKCINRKVLPGLMHCQWGHCLKPFRVNAGLLPSAIIRDGGFTFCPRCKSPNLLGQSPEGYHKCSGCSKAFLAVRDIEYLFGRRKAFA